MEPLQSEESPKAVSEEQENKREDTQARNCQSAEENVPSQWIGTLFQRAASEKCQDAGDDAPPSASSTGTRHHWPHKHNHKIVFCI